MPLHRVLRERLRRVAATLVMVVVPVAAAATWTVELHTGSSAHAPNTLTVSQAGYPTVRVPDARYETRPFVRVRSLADLTANYYAVRVGYFPAGHSVGGWSAGAEVELLHDRAIFVGGDDPDGIVERFELTNGLNHVFVNRVIRYAAYPDERHPDGRVEWLLRVGAGPVITSPKALVRGRSTGFGDATEAFYWLAGVGAQVAAQGRYYLTPHVALSAEIKGTTAQTHNRIAGGGVSAPMHGVQFNVGVSVRGSTRTH